MARTKRRIYDDNNLLSVTGISPTVATGIVIRHHTAPNSHQETLLRARAEVEAVALVNAPGFDIPPEFWWGQTYLVLAAFWLPSNSATLQPLDGSSEGYLGSVSLYPTRFPIETNAGEYAIVWKPLEPLVTQTARKSLTATTGPGVLFQVHMYDPQFVWSNGWADVDLNLSGRFFTLWEDP